MTKRELIRKLRDEDFLGDRLFELPIDLDDFRIVQSRDYMYEDGSISREELASMSLAEFLLDSDERSDESLWNPNEDDMDEFLNDQLWD